VAAQDAMPLDDCNKPFIRKEVILASLSALSDTTVIPVDAPATSLAAAVGVHSEGYLGYLSTAWAAWAALGADRCSYYFHPDAPPPQSIASTADTDPTSKGIASLVPSNATWQRGKLPQLPGTHVYSQTNFYHTDLCTPVYAGLLARCAFLTEIYTRVCHWFPRLLA
jgi:hypothetical protein